MSEARTHISPLGVVWRQFLIGTTFGVTFAVSLFVIEVLWLARHAHPYLGVPLVDILAVYAGFGWSVGALAGVASGILGVAFRRLVRANGTVPGVGPLLGFAFMALFIVRMETAGTLKTFPPTVMTSLVAAVLVWVGFGYLGRRVLFRYVPTGRRTPVLHLLALAAFLVAAGAMAAGRVQSNRLPKRTALSATSPNIVLIVVDALRPDHLQPYGYDRETSPNLERFAERGMVFDNAYSQGNRTIISMPALFTSLYPSFHGAIGFHERMVPLSKSKTTIAELCREAGYTTVGAMSNVYLKKAFGLTQGFDRVDEFELLRYRLSVYRVLSELNVVEVPDFDTNLPDATHVTDRGIDWLRRIGKRPFFLFLHYMDVHHPYLPPPEYERMFDSGSSDVDPRLLFAKTAAMVRNPPPLHLPDVELRRLVDLYDGCIRYTDAEIGRFLRELETRDLDRETYVFITADHGDEFLEHGSLYHTNLTIEPLIRVPLMVGRYPAPAGVGHFDGLIRHVDVLPTIAQLIGTQTPRNIQGVSFANLLEGGSGPTVKYSIAEGDFCTSLNTRGWKMMYVDSTGTYRLYDLTDDPLAIVDVTGKYPGKAAEMRAILDEYLASAAELEEGDEKTLSDDVIRQLRALGYIQ
jgi:arylsulfatase A-like enzyme